MRHTSSKIIKNTAYRLYELKPSRVTKIAESKAYIGKNSGLGIKNKKNKTMSETSKRRSRNLYSRVNSQITTPIRNTRVG